MMICIRPVSRPPRCYIEREKGDGQADSGGSEVPSDEAKNVLHKLSRTSQRSAMAAP